MKRLQRLRATAALRDMVSEIGFGQSQLIQPLFLSEGAIKEEPIAGLAGTSRHSLSSLLTQFEKDLSAGVRQFLLFPVPAHKSNRNFTAEFVGTATLVAIVIIVHAKQRTKKAADTTSVVTAVILFGGGVVIAVPR